MLFPAFAVMIVIAVYRLLQPLVMSNSRYLVASRIIAGAFGEPGFFDEYIAGGFGANVLSEFTGAFLIDFEVEVNFDDN
ncbi:hypothetical protein [Gracilimonas amylolytica]|uniref:hypothetical protein n=1 Tax=Gracilimonas amylolytica TaxID=1749045 RepID=UPI00130007BE|nr:hypothetical protein [Gracilimonas amylolytica]